MKKQTRMWLIVTYAIIFLLVVIRNLLLPVQGTSFIWFCDLAPLFLLIFTFIDNEQLNKAVVSIGFFPQLFVLLVIVLFIFRQDFADKLSSVVSSWDIASTLVTAPMFSMIVEIILHIFPVNLALIFTYKEKPTRKSLVYAGILLLLIYASTIVFTQRSANINLIYSSGLNVPYYSLLWPLLMFVFVVLPTHALQYGLWKLSRRNKQGNKRPKH